MFQFSDSPIRRSTVILVILALAGVAFELFNFDTTRFALTSLFGSSATIAGISWASVLAIAFCGIDFAGLIQIFTAVFQTQRDKQASYLFFAAWLMGATLNAVLTWYAVGITMLNHPIGSEIISRQQLLYWVPLTVAMLVWVTRILFIGGLSLIGEELLGVAVIEPIARPQREQAFLREMETVSAEIDSPELALNGSRQVRA